MKFYEIDISEFIYRTDYIDRTELCLSFKDGNLAKKICEHYMKDHHQNGAMAVSDIQREIKKSTWFVKNPYDPPKPQDKSDSFSAKWYNGNYEIDEIGNMKVAGKPNEPIPLSITKRFYKFVIPADELFRVMEQEEKIPYDGGGQGDTPPIQQEIL